MSEWIQCADKLPPANKEVRAVTREGLPCIASFTAGGCWIIGGSVEAPGFVVKWRPLFCCIMCGHYEEDTFDSAGFCRFKNELKSDDEICDDFLPRE